MSRCPNDPLRPLTGADYKRRVGPVYQLIWGRGVTPEGVDKFLAKVNANLVITGHQPQEEGFLRANHRQLILDGTDPNPSYCLLPAKTPVRQFVYGLFALGWRGSVRQWHHYEVAYLVLAGLATPLVLSVHSVV